MLPVFHSLAPAAEDSSTTPAPQLDLVKMVKSESPALTVDKFLAAAFREKKNSYIDQESGVLMIQDTLVIDPKKFESAQLPNLNKLAQTGQWIAENGQHYDLRKAAIIFQDGNGGFADQMAYFSSEEFSRAVRDPFGVDYPPSPYTNGITPGEFIEDLIRNLGPGHYYIDAASVTIVVPRLNLPLHGLDVKFCLEVIDIALSGKVWTSASGTRYDFSQTAVTYPFTDLGTQDQRQVQAETRQQLKGRLYAFLDESATIKNSQPKISTTMNAVSLDGLPKPFLKRFKHVDFLKPKPDCDRLLLEQTQKDKK